MLITDDFVNALRRSMQVFGYTEAIQHRNQFSVVVGKLRVVAYELGDSGIYCAFGIEDNRTGRNLATVDGMLPHAAITAVAEIYTRPELAETKVETDPRQMEFAF